MAGVLNEIAKKERKGKKKQDVPQIVPDSEWLSRKEASAFLCSIGCPVSPQTLANMGSNNNAGKGPPYLRFRWNSVRYRRADLIEWAKPQGEWVK